MEFLAQGLQLAHAHEQPGLLCGGTLPGLRALGRSGNPVRRAPRSSFRTTTCSCGGSSTSCRSTRTGRPTACRATPRSSGHWRASCWEAAQPQAELLAAPLRSVSRGSRRPTSASCRELSSATEASRRAFSSWRNCAAAGLWVARKGPQGGSAVAPGDISLGRRRRETAGALGSRPSGERADSFFHPPDDFPAHDQLPHGLDVARQLPVLVENGNVLPAGLVRSFRSRWDGPLSGDRPPGRRRAARWRSPIPRSG